MKTLILSAIISFINIAAFAQIDKMVIWTKSVKKVAAKTYELHMSAKINKGFRLYSQYPGDGPVPTRFTISKNTLAVINPKIKEVGKVIKAYDESFKTVLRYYENTVVFVIIVKIKSPTTIAGKVEYMTSSDHESLPPTAMEFSAKLN